MNCKNCIHEGVCWKQEELLGEREQEEEQECCEDVNLFMKLPCKVGDMVYWLDNTQIKQGEVFEISIHIDGILIHTGTRYCLTIDEIFLTKEEAEKAPADITNKRN